MERKGAWAAPSGRRPRRPFRTNQSGDPHDPLLVGCAIGELPIVGFIATAMGRSLVMAVPRFLGQVAPSSLVSSVLSRRVIYPADTLIANAYGLSDRPDHPPLGP